MYVYKTISLYITRYLFCISTIYNTLSLSNYLHKIQTTFALRMPTCSINHYKHTTIARQGRAQSTRGMVKYPIMSEAGALWLINLFRSGKKKRRLWRSMAGRELQIFFSFQASELQIVLSNAEWLVRFDSSALAAWPLDPGRTCVWSRKDLAPCTDE
jgi:hypothetical protein